MDRKAISGRGTRLTALLLGRICPICTFVAPCHPSAPLRTSLYDSCGHSTSPTIETRDGLPHRRVVG